MLYQRDTRTYTPGLCLGRTPPDIRDNTTGTLMDHIGQQDSRMICTVLVWWTMDTFHVVFLHGEKARNQTQGIRLLNKLRSNLWKEGQHDAVAVDQLSPGAHHSKIIFFLFYFPFSDAPLALFPYIGFLGEAGLIAKTYIYSARVVRMHD